MHGSKPFLVDVGTPSMRDTINLASAASLLLAGGMLLMSLFQQHLGQRSSSDFRFLLKRLIRKCLFFGAFAGARGYNASSPKSTRIASFGIEDGTPKLNHVVRNSLAARVEHLDPGGLWETEVRREVRVFRIKARAVRHSRTLSRTHA